MSKLDNTTIIFCLLSTSGTLKLFIIELFQSGAAILLEQRCQQRSQEEKTYRKTNTIFGTSDV